MRNKIVFENDKLHLSDYAIEGIIIESDKAYINVSFEGYKARIICNRFIGISYLGQWDEGIISNAKVKKDGDIIKDSLNRIQKNNDINYLEKHYSDWRQKKWKVLEIMLVDDIKIEIACKEVIFEYEKLYI